MKNRIPKLLLAAFAIASAVGLSSTGGQALAATVVPPAAQAAASTTAGAHDAYTADTSSTIVSPDYVCASSTLCLFQDTGLTGNACPFPMPQSGDTEYSIRAYCGFTVPWGSLNDNTGSRVIFIDNQSGVQYCEPAGYRGTPPLAVRNTGTIYIQYGVTLC